MTIERTVKITECEYDALLAAFTLYQMHQEDYPAPLPLARRSGTWSHYEQVEGGKPMTDFQPGDVIRFTGSNWAKGLRGTEQVVRRIFNRKDFSGAETYRPPLPPPNFNWL